MIKTLLFVAACLSASAYAEMKVIDDESLSAISGQLGINVGISIDLNAAVIELADNVTVDAPVAGCGVAAANYKDGLPGTCRLALEIVNRTGEWLVFKDFYGHLRIPDFYIDGGTFAEAGGASFFDGSKFLDDDGSSCLLGDCVTAASLAGLNAIVFSVPPSEPAAPGYNPGTGISSNYDDLSLALTIGGMAVEYGAAGYDADIQGSFLGLKIADNNNIYAGADIQGKAYVYGF